MNEICGDNRFEIIARAKKALLEGTNIDTSPKEMEVLDDFLFRCWQMGWLDRYDRKTENSSENPNNCEYAENPSGDVWECGCFLDTYCEHQIYDRNPDGTINIVECGYEPKDEPQTCSFSDCDNFKNPDYERCIECKRKQIKLKTEQTEREGER